MQCQHPHCQDEGDYPLIVNDDGEAVRFFFCAEHHEHAKRRRSGGEDLDIDGRIESLFGKKFQDATFETYRTDPKYLRRIAEQTEAVRSGSEPALKQEDIENLQDAKSSLRSFTGRMIEGGEGTVFLFGPNGLGKTHLLAASTRELLKEGMTVSSWHMTRLVNTIRATYSDSASEEIGTVRRIIGSMKESDVLVLQDINELCFGKDTRHYIFEIIDEVYREESIMMMSANLSPEQLMDDDRLGEPPVTRILEPPSCIKRLSGPSHRQARKAYEKQSQ